MKYAHKSKGCYDFILLFIGLCIQSVQGKAVLYWLGNQLVHNILIYIVTEGMDNPLGEVEIKKMKDQLRKEQDTSATLLQELHDTRTQVNSCHLFDKSFFLYSFFLCLYLCHVWLIYFFRYIYIEILMKPFLTPVNIRLKV